MNKLINKNRLIDTFMDMVRIDSESGNESSFANYMVNLAIEIGCKVKKDKYNNIYIFVDGNGRPMMLNTHMDTVSPGKGVKPKIKDNYIVSSGDTILGADSKAGIAAMIEIIRVINENNLKHRPFEINLTCNEESGIPTASYIKSKIKECIVPDRGTPLGEIIIEAPFAQVFEVVVRGKSVYATTDFDKGIHSILAATKIISLLKIGNFDKYSTSNVGIINGGTVTSVVPDYCSFRGNCYSFQEKSISNFLKHLKEQMKKVDRLYKTKSELILHEYFGGYRLNKENEIVKLAYNSIKGVGIKPKYKTYKAVSNANILNSIGIKSILISTGVEYQHTVNERISIENLTKLGGIILNIVTTI